MVPRTAHHTSWTAPTMTRSVHTTTGGAQTPSTIGIAIAEFTIRVCKNWCYSVLSGLKHKKAAKWIHISCTAAALVFNLKEMD